MIRRAPHQTDYVVIRNKAIRDVGLSFKARGVLSLLLSMPDDWKVTEAWIVRQSEHDGRDAVAAAMKELISAGYIQRTKRQGSGGRWLWDSLVHESPAVDADIPAELPDETAGYPLSDYPLPDYPLPGEPLSDNPESEEVTINEVPNDVVPIGTRDTPPTDFSTFWNAYPRKVGKRTAHNAYRSAVKRATPDEILDGIRRALPGWVQNEAKFIPHPSTWLNRDGWDDGDELDLEHQRREIASQLNREKMGLPDPWAEQEAIG